MPPFYFPIQKIWFGFAKKNLNGKLFEFDRPSIPLWEEFLDGGSDGMGIKKVKRKHKTFRVQYFILFRADSHLFRYSLGVQHQVSRGFPPSFSHDFNTVCPEPHQMLITVSSCIKEYFLNKTTRYVSRRVCNLLVDAMPFKEGALYTHPYYLRHERKTYKWSLVLSCVLIKSQRINSTAMNHKNGSRTHGLSRKESYE